MNREITFEEGWSYIQTGVTKLIRIIEGEPEPAFEPQLYVELYTTVYKMCIQKHNHSNQLYAKYREVIVEYTEKMVLPSLREKPGEYMLRELVKRWNNHKVLVRWLTNFFRYIDQYSFYRPGKTPPPLTEAGLRCFHDLVYHEMQSTAKDAVIELIHKEREGEQIDRALVKNVLDIYVENGMETMKKYEEDFESFMLQDTACYYSRKASKWIQEDSCPDYMIKAEKCLEMERERVTNYLHYSTEPKLVEKVQNELLVVVARYLLLNEYTGFRALLVYDKMDDLSRMYRLYHPILQGLEPIAELFKQHITAEGNALIRQADDAATNQILFQLHNKYMVYVTECFQNHTLFHKGLEESFEILRKEKAYEKLNGEFLDRCCI